MIALAVVALTLAFALFLLAAERNIRRRQADERFAHDVTEREIEETIRQNVAPETRPYGAGGQFIRDGSGKTYATAADGSLRRVELVQTGEHEAQVFSVRKWDKAKKKAMKRAHHRAEDNR